MVSVVDTIRKINDFEKKLSEMAFYYRSPLKLYPKSENDPDAERTILGAINKLKQMVSESKDNQIQFKSMGELQEFGMLNQILEMALKNKTKDEVKRDVKGTDPLIIFYKDLIRNYNYWLSRKKYIVIPPDIQYEAEKDYNQLLAFYKLLSKEKKKRLEPFMISLHNKVKKEMPNFFKEKIAEKESLILILIEKWRKDQVDKGKYLDNTYMYVPEIEKVFGRQALSALMTVMSWASQQEDPRYLFSADEVRTSFFEYLKNIKASAEMKALMKEKELEMQMEKDRADRAEALKKSQDPEFMQSQRHAEINRNVDELFQSTGETMREIEEGAMQYSAMVNNIDPQTQVSLDEARSLRGNITDLQRQAETLLDRTKQVASNLE